MSLQLSWQQWPEYKQLMRLDKPIGIYLLLWPTWWALWLAADGTPSLTMWLVFSIGVVLMRSAGCVINDFADRNFDGAVERTKLRPLAAGRVSSAEALQLFVLLLLLSAALLVFLNWQTWLLSLVAVLLAASYPFMKRYTHLPQVVLGMAFSWGMPMCFMAIQQQLPLQVWLLYAANLCWTVAYDTYYALVDQNDDEKIGIKSTARLFGAYARPIIMTLQVIALLLMAATGWIQQLHVSFYFVISLALPLFYWQFNLSKTGRAGCFKAFLDNHYVGMLWFLAILIGIYWPNA